MRLLITAGLCALLLSACGTTGPDLPDIAPVTPLAPDPCPASARAALEAPPVAPVLTEAQQAAVDRAIAGAVGPALGLAVIGFRDVLLPAYAARQADRVEDTRAWCDLREGRGDGQIAPNG